MARYQSQTPMTPELRAAVDAECTENLRRLGEALRRLATREAEDRATARDALLKIIPIQPAVAEPHFLDKVAEDTGIDVQEAQLVFGSLLQSGEVTFNPDYSVSRPR